ADFDAAGVLYSAATGPFWFPFATQQPVDVAAAIAASDYRLNPTFADAHHYDQGLARLNAHFVYISLHGDFTYDLDGHGVRPILLMGGDDESGVTVEYRNPVVLEDGSIFLQALESTDGATGADGPIYRVDFTL